MASQPHADTCRHLFGISLDCYGLLAWEAHERKELSGPGAHGNWLLLIRPYVARPAALALSAGRWPLLLVGDHGVKPPQTSAPVVCTTTLPACAMVVVCEAM